MFKCGLLQVQHLLSLVIQLQLDGPLAAEHRLLHLLDTCEQRLYLVAEDSLLVREGYQVLLLRPLDNLVHSHQALLELSHQSPLTLEDHAFLCPQLFIEALEFRINSSSSVFFCFHSVELFFFKTPLHLFY
jgi:hypothetical protein